jgi:hypothetical protein
MALLAPEFLALFALLKSVIAAGTCLLAKIRFRPTADIPAVRMGQTT